MKVLMLNKNDFALLRGMFETYKKDTIAEMGEETKLLILAFEHRLVKKIDLLRTEVAEILDDHVIASDLRARSQDVTD